jgi:DNA-binding CsgD family transcriptional regulator
VARLIADDRTNDQIAKELCISPHTARHHTERILAKLGASSRTQVRTTLVGG